ncbi:MAG: hypothetical protein HYR74_05000 [Candidatus Eisenbacteria bacterium]|nr:hypothetical protein [Candidatus Eisenbacteria bacterium]
MSDYPSSSPWGPHGPQVSPQSVTPNPTAPSSVPDFGGFAPAPASAPFGGGGVRPSGGGGGGAIAAMSGPRFGRWVLNFALLGTGLGAIAGGLAGLGLHLPGAALGGLALRWAIAGAAVGASVPPAVRSIVTLIRAAGWGLVTLVLWWIAIAASGQLGWLQRLR